MRPMSQEEKTAELVAWLVARRLFQELMSAEADRRWTLARQAGFGSLELADLLVQESLRVQSEEPGWSEELAELALAVAERVEPGAAEGRANDLKALALCLMANARRLRGDWPGAEEALGAVAVVLTAPPDSFERAFYCQTLAWLREAQGQVHEAVALLWRAARVFRAVGAPEEQRACLGRLGALSGR
ncbi:MAG TPA: hypothetical protein VF756_12980 [Thermoanaerobaculia bacterium]